MHRACAAVIAAIALVASGRASAADVAFLPVPASGNSVAQDVNNRGEIVGIVDEANVFVLGPHDAAPRKYSFPGRVQSVGNNDRGDIVGTYQLVGQPVVSFRIDRDGTIQTLTIPGLSAVNVVVEDINDHGAIVGWFYDTMGATTPIHAFVYTNGQVQQLDNPLGQPVTAATGIANNGTIVGYFGGTFDDPKQAFVLRKGDFTAVTFENADSFLFDVESNGNMVGLTNSGGFLLRHGRRFVGFGNDFIARGVNAAGVVVGESEGKAAIIVR